MEEEEDAAGENEKMAAQGGEKTEREIERVGAGGGGYTRERVGDMNGRFRAFLFSFFYLLNFKYTQ